MRRPDRTAPAAPREQRDREPSLQPQRPPARQARPEPHPLLALVRALARADAERLNATIIGEPT